MNPYNFDRNINTYAKYPYLNGYLDYFKSADLMQLGSCYCKKSYFRVLNTYENAPLDVQINEIIIAENLKMGGFTRYIQFAPGVYKVKINESGVPKKLIFETNVKIDQNLAYTGVITKDDEDPTDVSILMIPDAKENSIPGRMSALRMANIAFDAPDLDLATSDGTILFSRINYGDVSNNIAVPSGKYTLQLQTRSGKNNVLKVPNIEFAPKMHYTLYITGNGSKDSDFKIIIPEDGVNYLGLC